GRIADRVGRKRVFILGLLLFAAASGPSAVAPSLNVLIAARVLQAVGGAMMLPTTLGLILPAFPVEQRTLAIGIWSAVGGVAAALGPPIGGLLVQLSWRWIFVVNVPIGIVTAIVAARVLQEVREPKDGRPDLLGAAELALGIGLLTLGIVKGPDWGWADPRDLACFAGAIALVVAFVVRSARHHAPVIELPLLRVRYFALAKPRRDRLLRRLRRDAALRRPAADRSDRSVGLLGADRRLRALARTADGGDLRDPVRAPRRQNRSAPRRGSGRPRLRR
ncbi:MAG TPA: MFS transporter, partial [Solirubrobacterales bacterium]|nr:MFS transporter [Solirubrobacterales bacterium]